VCLRTFARRRCPEQKVRKNLAALRPRRSRSATRTSRTVHGRWSQNPLPLLRQNEQFIRMVSTCQTRIRGSRQHPSGRLSRRVQRRSSFPPGLRGCAYKPTSGRLAWPSRDPINEPGFRLLTSNQNSFSFDDEKNLYDFVQSNPNGFIDAVGLSGTIAFPIWRPVRPDPISCAFAVGGAVGTGLCLAFPDTMTKLGLWIGNLMCRRNKLCTYICVTKTGRAGIIRIAISVGIPCQPAFTGPTGTLCMLVNGNPGGN
jgi:hypothetical protein